MSDLLLPRRDEVDAVLLSVRCESWIGWNDEADYRALRDYFAPISKVDPDAVEIWDRPGPSEYDPDVDCFRGVANGLFTLEEWLEIASGYGLDLGEDDVLPRDQLTPTMGILTGDGALPAVALNHTEEGWGYGGYEPRLAASFYVALTTHDTGDER